jgi:Matrixin
MTLASSHTVAPSQEPRAPEHSRAPGKSRSKAVLLRLALFSTVVGVTAAAAVGARREKSRIVTDFVSGSPALKRSTDGEAIRWHDATVTVYLDASLDPLGDGAREAIQAGFGTWITSDATLPALRFDATRGAKFTAVPNGKSEVSYGQITLDGHEKNLALTVTYSDEKTGRVVEADTVFNSDYAYGLLDPDSTDAKSSHYHDDCNGRYDLQNVASHEVGHFFGLGEDYDVKEATMYYSTGRCETNKRDLQSSDRATMTDLYVNFGSENQADPAAAKGCAIASVGGARTNDSTAALALGALALCFGVSRRRQRSQC